MSLLPGDSWRGVFKSSGGGSESREMRSRSSRGGRGTWEGAVNYRAAG